MKVQFNKSFFTLFLLLFFIKASAQTSLDKYTLEKCINYALDNNYGIRQINSEISESSYKTKEMQSKLLPQITGSGSIDRNLVIPTIILPGEIVGLPGEKLPIQNGTKNFLDFSARIEQVIYDPHLFQGLKIAKNNQELKQLRKSLTEEEMIYNVSYVFYEIISSEKEGTDVNIILSKQEELSKIIEQRIKEGVSRPIDLNRIQVNINNHKLKIKDLENLIFQKKNYLKTLIGFPVDETFEISYPSSDLNQTDDIFFTSTEHDYLELDILEKQKQIVSLQINQEKKNYLPTLSGLISGGYQFQSDELRITKDPWFSSVVVGLRLSVPIFDGFSKRNKIRQLQFQGDNLDFQIVEFKQNMLANEKNALKQLQTSLELINGQKHNLSLAEDNYGKTYMLYQQGLISITDVFDTEATLLNTKISYSKELINYKKNQIDLLKAQGKLKNISKR